MYVNHIPKCAGTTLYYLVESRFADREILGTERAEALYDLASPLLGYLPPAVIDRYRMVFGHFGETLRRTWFENMFSVGLTRNITDKFVSTMAHALREPLQRSLPLSRFVLDESDVALMPLYNNLVKTSHLYYYCGNSFQIDKILNAGQPESDEVISLLENTSSSDRISYDTIVDSVHMPDFCEAICRKLGVRYTVRNVSTFDDINNGMILSRMDDLRRLFPRFFEVEEVFQRRLLARSEAIIEDFGILDRLLDRAVPISINLSDALAIEGFSKREYNLLSGWTGEHVRTIEEPDARINIDTHEVSGNICRVTLCFWRLQFDDEITVRLSNCEIMEEDWLFPSYPDEHLIYYRAKVRVTGVMVTCDLGWNGAGRVDFLGGAIIPIITALAPTHSVAAVEHGSARPGLR